VWAPGKIPKNVCL